MVKKPTSPLGDSTSAPQPSASPEPRDAREAAIDALLELAAERPWSRIALTDIAERAGLSLKDLRAHYPSKGAILGAFSRRIDLQVLADESKDMQDEAPRERLFDVLMRRFDALRPYRPALRSITRGLRQEPLSLAAMNRVTVNAMQWMLAAAGISDEGPLAAAKAQGLALLYARVMDTFLDDDDPGLSRTLRALDGELRSAERWANRARDLESLCGSMLGMCRRVAGAGRRRSSRAGESAGTEEPSPSI